MWYLAGSEHPVSAALVRAHLRTGHLSATALLWTPGMVDYQPVHTLVAFADVNARAPHTPQSSAATPSLRTPVTAARPYPAASPSVGPRSTNHGLAGSER